MSATRKRVCIIGAGPVGLLALKCFTEESSKFDVVVYEQSDKVGGLWNYSEATGVDEDGQIAHSAMYKSLVLNTPNQLMSLDGMPMDENPPCFIRHEEYLKYLNDYADKFNLRKFIKFNSRVVWVRPEVVGGGALGTTWRVDVQPTEDRSARTQSSVFDVVVVCNGHQWMPKYPQSPGLEDFEGLKLHSKDYRHVEEFSDKTVLCMGGSSSAWDIAIDISSIAQNVYISHHAEQIMKKFPENVEMVPGVQTFTKTGAILTDGRNVEFNAVLLCTGYRYSFPFLSPDCGIEVTKENTVEPLYLDMINVNHPSMTFFGINDIAIPNALALLQARYLITLLDGGIQLPSKDEMKKSIQEQIQARLDSGLHYRHLHNLMGTQEHHFEQLIKLGGLKPLPAWYHKLSDKYFELVFDDIALCKKTVFKIIEPDSFEYKQ